MLCAEFENVGETTLLQLLLVIPDTKLKTQHFELNYPQEKMICHK